MKVIVLGSNGQLGRSLKSLENKSNLEIIFFDKKKLNINSRDDLEENINFNRPDIIINTSAYTDVVEAESDYTNALKVNFEGVKNIALICKKYSIKLIHFSTDYVFDGLSKKPYTENDATNPINNYGKSKLAGEKVLQEILTEHIIIRTSWLYSHYNGNFFTTIARKLIGGEELNVVDDQIGRPTSVRLLSNATYEILNKIQSQELHWGIYHIAGKEIMSWYEFAKVIQQTLLHNGYKNQGFIKKSKTNHLKSRVYRPMYSVLNCEKYEKAFMPIKNSIEKDSNLHLNELLNRL